MFSCLNDYYLGFLHYAKMMDQSYSLQMQPCIPDLKRALTGLCVALAHLVFDSPFFQGCIKQLLTSAYSFELNHFYTIIHNLKEIFYTENNALMNN